MEDEILELLLRHGVALNQFANGWQRRSIALFNRILEIIRAAVQQSDLEGYQGNATESLLQRIDTQIALEIQTFLASFREELPPLAEDEAEYGAAILAALGITAIAADRTLFDRLIETPIRGPATGVRTIDQWFQSVDSNVRARVIDQIRAGYLDGLTDRQIIASLRNFRLPARLAQMLTATVINAVSNLALIDQYQRNGINRIRWISVLDSRTSIICWSRHNRIFPITGPYPPAHPNCRSTTLPVTPGNQLNLTDTTTWLQSQSKEIQLEILGESRRRLFLDGDLKPEQFLATDTRILTLRELRARYAEAFRRSGVRLAG